MAGRSAGRELGEAMHRLAVGWAVHDTQLARQLGLSSTDYIAVKHLMVSPEPLGPADLARRLGMSTGSVNALVNRLVGAGHLVRRAHPTDRRRLLLEVSTATQESVLRSLQPSARRLDDLAGAMTGSEIAVVLRFLRDAIPSS